MLSIRIAAASAASVMAVALAIGGAAAQTDASPGKPIQLLQLQKPDKAKASAHAKVAVKTVHTTTHISTTKNVAKKIARKTAVGKTIAKKATATRTTAAATPSTPWPAPSAPIAVTAAVPANVWPAAGAPAPENTAAVESAVEPAPAPATPTVPMSAIVVGGQTVQIASQDDVNEIDLAAGEKTAAAVTNGENAEAEPETAALTALSAQQNTSAVGSASWIAQVLAALGGAVAAGTVAWFLIGGAPQRTYG